MAFIPPGPKSRLVHDLVTSARRVPESKRERVLDSTFKYQPNFRVVCRHFRLLIRIPEQTFFGGGLIGRKESMKHAVFPGRVQCSEDGSTVFAGRAKLLAKGKSNHVGGETRKQEHEREEARELESKNDRKVFTCESLRLSRRTSETIVFLSCSSFSPAHASGIWLFSFARPSGRTWSSGRRALLGTNVVSLN